MPKLLPQSASASPQESSLRLPANRRIATPVSHRLNSITDPSATPSRSSSIAQPAADNASDAASPTPRRRSLASIRLNLPFPRRESGSSKISHPAPPYDWVPEPIEDRLDGRVPIEGEKLRQLRREDDEGKIVLWWRRKRVAFLVVGIVVVIALAIGLGVGLSPRRSVDKNAVGAGNSTAAPLEFPLGQWTVGATLVGADTGCTSNADIWRCYPYVIGGRTIFDLTIANTSALYAPNSMLGADTGPAGIAANLTVSSSNPFAIPFANQSMTYFSTPTNATAARLEWTFSMDKSVMPSSPVMDDGGAAQCTFSGTVFTGTLYLNFLGAVSDQEGDEKQWPHAAEIRQTRDSGAGAVTCKGMTGGSMSVPEASGSCSCVYRNY